MFYKLEVKKLIDNLTFGFLGDNIKINKVLCNAALIGSVWISCLVQADDPDEEIVVSPDIVYFKHSWGPDGPVKSLAEFANFINPEKEAEYSACVAAEPKQNCQKYTLSGSWKNLSGPKRNGYTSYIQIGFGSNPQSYYGEARTWEFPGIAVQVAFQCPEGYFQRGEGPEDNITIQCVYRPSYKAVLTKFLPRPKHCAGNPIDISNGAKIQSEAENLGSLEIPFKLVYNNIDKQSTPEWRHNFQKTILPFDQDNAKHVLAKSNAHLGREAACLSGWEQIKPQVRGEWVQVATASYSCGLCEIKYLGKRVTILSIVEASSSALPALKLGKDAVRIKQADGYETTFTLASGCGNSEWVNNDGRSDIKLTSGENGGFKFLYSSGESEIYNAKGQLETQFSPGGTAKKFTYDAVSGNLNGVSIPGGNRLEFDYQYYPAVGVLLNGERMANINYGTNGLISSIKRADQATRIYHYEDARFPAKLTGITDERGVRYATWKYDDQGRAISSEHAGGAEKTSLFFNADGSTSVINALGKKTTYSFTDILGMRRVSTVTGEPTANCVGAYQAYTYTPQGLVETKTDWKGQVTKYTYDNYGRELTQTRAFGTADATTVQTCWHETLNQPSSIIEPTRVTLIDYFPSGQIKSQTVKPRPMEMLDCNAAI